ncbi:MAG TPA: DUF2231 domain-containing protein [Fimbriimonas sp.]|nr:DUF2231 domain-containing protein [Fimbriimonas sp.]
MAFLRLFGCFFVLIWWASAQAKPEFLDVLLAKYRPAEGSQIATAACLICHAAPGPPVRNAFGKQVESALQTASAEKLTAAILSKVENEDADGDGRSNMEQIRSGQLPSGSSPAPEDSPLIPTHSFHPMVVHFPIAIFIFGALFDYFGFRKGRPEARYGGLVAMWVGALASLLAMPTGLAALLRLGFDLSGVALAHLIVAIGASILMLTLAWLRRRQAYENSGYWAALALAIVSVAVAGHLGATLVYS